MISGQIVLGQSMHMRATCLISCTVQETKPAVYIAVICKGEQPMDRYIYAENQGGKKSFTTPFNVSLLQSPVTLCPS